jgi:single-strand DNA-binding protein
VWRSQAEHLADSLAKGDRVMVTGRLRQRSWETPEGDKRWVTEIEADEVRGLAEVGHGQGRTHHRAGH